MSAMPSTRLLSNEWVVINSFGVSGWKKTHRFLPLSKAFQADVAIGSVCTGEPDLAGPTINHWYGGRCSSGNKERRSSHENIVGTTKSKDKSVWLWLREEEEEREEETDGDEEDIWAPTLWRCRFSMIIESKMMNGFRSWFDFM